MKEFLTIVEVEEILNSIYKGIPKDIFKGLTGGVNLLEQSKLHKESRQYNRLYILGEYIVDPTGRRINIYYGSLRELFYDWSYVELEGKLREILYHELTHHIESLAGENTLEIEDYLYMEEYKKNNDLD